MSTKLFAAMYGMDHYHGVQALHVGIPCISSKIQIIVWIIKQLRLLFPRLEP